ncbi:MAG TPA: protein Mom [Bellilinea sp.]|nr:protein Mom [Bellilinea sp.]
MNLRLDWCSHEAAKYAVEHWHYSRCMPIGKLVKIGVWENEQFIGCVIFGYGNNQYQGNQFGLIQTQICELLRVALTKHETTVTKIVKIALRMLKESNAGIRLVVSYADPEQGHNGGIYQGGNWAFIGVGGSDEAFYNKRGERIHSRLVGKGGKKNVFGRVISTYDSDTTTKRKLLKKYKYVYPLDNEMRKQIEPLRKPYPKRGRGETDNAPQSNEETGGASPTRPL